jgi:hypothetical protein
MTDQELKQEFLRFCRSQMPSTSSNDAANNQSIHENLYQLAEAHFKTKYGILIWDVLERLNRAEFEARYAEAAIKPDPGFEEWKKIYAALAKTKEDISGAFQMNQDYADDSQFHVYCTTKDEGQVREICARIWRLVKPRYIQLKVHLADG